VSTSGYHTDIHILFLNAEAFSTAGERLWCAGRIKAEEILRIDQPTN
jgi:hypothetical protein